MGDTYTRQSSYTDGDVITAAHTNDEFNQLLAAFAASSGHTHDGTTGEGGPVSALLSNTITIGANNDNDIVLTFDANSSNGVLSWKEDEDYFEFSDDLLIASTEKLQFRDTGLYIYSSADGQLDIVADTEVQIAATTIDINGAVDVSGNLDVGGNLTVTGTTTFNGGTLTLGDAASDNVVFGADVNSSIIPNTDNTYDLGSSGQEWRDIYIDGIAYIDSINLNGTAITSTAEELNILDGVTASAADINLIDGITNGTVIASKALIADANIDITGGRNITITGELDAGSLDISGDADIDGTLEADAITIGGVTLSETIADTVGAMVTSNTETGITVAYDDADNTLDFTVGTLNQDTTGNAATATALETARTIGGTSFDGTANIAVGLADTATALATARTIGGTSFDGTANIAVALSATATALATARTIHGVSFDGTANIDLSEVVSDTVGAMVSSNTETGITVTYQDADNTIDFEIGAGAIVNSMLADDAVGADELAASAVVTASIVDANVTTAKIATDAITEAKIADNAVESEHINDNVISGQTSLASGIADADELLISDAGSIKRTAMSVIKTYIGAADDATALAIALG
jgi:cytoskeletal protein CcmA (bactofilin family)